MPIHETKLGAFGFYKNNLGENRKLLWGRDADRIRVARRSIDRLDKGDVSVSSRLYDAAKHATPYASQVAKVMEKFSHLYESLERGGFIGQAGEAQLLRTRNDDSSGVRLRFMPAGLGEYGELSDSPELFSLIRDVMDAPVSVWDFRTAHDMQDSSQYTGLGYTELGSIVAVFGRSVPLTEGELIVQSMSYALSRSESQQVLYDASALPTTRMVYSTSETLIYGRMTPVGL